MWKPILAISIGSAAGGLSRWWLGIKLNAVFPTLPPGTLAANVIAGYIIGAAVGVFTQFPGLAPEWRLLVMGVTPQECDRLFARLQAEQVQIFYVKSAVEFGKLGGA